MKDQKKTAITVKQGIFLICFGVILSVLCLEGGLELYSYLKGGSFSSVDDLRHTLLSDRESQDNNGVSLKSLIYPSDSDKIIYSLKPNLDVRFQRTHVRTNSCGMRQPEVSIAKDPDTFRIALLGDSFAFGWGVEENESFASILQENLQALAPIGRKVEILNFGVPGYSTFQEVFQFLETGAEFKPDAVLVFFIQNDFGPPFFIKNMAGDGIATSSEIAQLAMKLLDPSAPKKALENAGLDPNRALGVLADYSNETGTLIYLTINPKADWKKYFKMLWVLKKRSEIQFLSLRQPYESVVKEYKYRSEELTLSFDPHPSPLRHKIYGDILTPPFIPLLRAKDAGNE